MRFFIKKRSLQIGEIQYKGEMADFFYCLKYKGDMAIL